MINTKKDTQVVFFFCAKIEIYELKDKEVEYANW